MRQTRWLIVLLSFLVVACGGGGGANNGDPQCSDNVDNDGDGATDFPEDLGCTDESDDSEDSSPMPQCSDGRDNDGDGKTDYPNDPGCFSRHADDETDDCPDGPNCPQCSNGKDDDENGQTDFPSDSGCEFAGDPLEFLNNPVACGAGLVIQQLPPSGEVKGSLESGSQSMIMSPCGGGAGAHAVAYVIQLLEPKVLVVSTDSPETTIDTVIDIRGTNCSDPAAHLACNDDVNATNDRSTVTASLAAGLYYIIVQGRVTGVTGSFGLKVEKFTGEGTPCTMQEECGPGLHCRTPLGGSQQVCSQPQCSDGLDDDGDGKIDYPNDPGCASAEDNSEADSCPGVGPDCPECGDGVDNDGDGTIDYPADPTCKSAGDTSESCVTSEGVVALTMPLTPGDTTNAIDDVKLSCSSSTATAKDRTYRLDIPATTTLKISLLDKVPFWSSEIALFNSTCGGASLSCSATTFTQTNFAAGTYYLVVDGYSTGFGPYKIAVEGTIVNGASCESPLATSGALKCGTGYACKGTAGARTCQIAQCNDGVDNNGNGKTDYPTDPGCTSPSDDTETTVCPGANCPVCSNGIDDDMDGLIDYPADTSCVAASSSNESCVSSEPVVTVTTATTMGDTSTAIDDGRQSCASTTSTAKDLHYRLDLPALASLTITPTQSFDAVVALYDSSCTGASLQCADFGAITRTNLAAGTYYYVTDGWSTGSGPFSFTVAGTIAAGGSCESALAQAGALVCGSGQTCQGTVGSRTCQP